MGLAQEDVTEVAEVVAGAADVVADHMADALNRMKTAILLTWQKWQMLWQML